MLNILLVLFCTPSGELDAAAFLRVLERRDSMWRTRDTVSERGRGLLFAASGTIKKQLRSLGC